MCGLPQGKFIHKKYIKILKVQTSACMISKRHNIKMQTIEMVAPTFVQWQCKVCNAI